ncbi:MAG: hypothetical protein K1V92_13240, partial [Bacteroides acidifaciens]
TGIESRPFLYLYILLPYANTSSVTITPGIVNQNREPFPTSESTPTFSTQLFHDTLTDGKPQSRTMHIT